MKILFTADIHIKLGQKGVPVDWAVNRYEMLLDRLWELQEQSDVFIIGGDVFDKLPNMEELEIYFNLVASCKIPTFIYSGNHEALRKNTTFLSSLKTVTNKLNSAVTILDDYHSWENIDFIPYNKLKDYNTEQKPFTGSILCTHVRGEIPPHVKPEMPLELFDSWKVVLAGDLHSYDNCQRNILYPGSPVTTSFHRSIVDTGVIILDSESLEHTWSKLELPQLLRKTVKAGEPTPQTDYHHTVYEVEGDISELGVLEDSDIIDKKVLKRELDTALILTPDLTLEQEVQEYLTYVLQVNEKSVEKALLELSNYADKIK